MIGKTNWIGTAVMFFGVVAGLAGGMQAAAQASDWIWVNGSSTIGTTCVSTYPCGSVGVYGTRGVFATANLPGSRTDAISWTDTTGHKWLFGGFGYDANGALGEEDDLWQTNASGTSWEWVSGYKGAGNSGIYGTLGTAAASNVPGGRQDAMSWTDKIGNLWVFGGFGYDGNTTRNYGYENDLWMYNPTTNQWTWEAGSSTVPLPQTTIFGTTLGVAAGVYGTMGTPATGNTPGGRTSGSTWVDSSGNLWLFGGGFVDQTGYEEVYNDLWEFNTTTKQWVWVEGSSNTGQTDQTGVYGTMGTAASANIPGARYLAGSWTDPAGNFWLFGGSGYASNAGQYNLNDLWKFSPTTGQWTWVGGPSVLYACNFLFSTPCPYPGTYGTEGTAASTNFPGGRSASVTWTDSSGNLWLFGGSGQDANNNGAWLNDLWQYNPGTTYWTWMGGSSTIPTTCTTGNCGQPGVYGTLGTAASANVPGARVTSVSWTDQSGNFWLFGGWGEDSASTTGYLNDVWEYQPAGVSSTPTAATPTFSVAAGTYTTTQTVTLADSTAGATIYYTTNGTTPTTSSSVYGGAITVSSTETVEAIAVASGYSNSGVATAVYTITTQAATPTFSVAAGTYTSTQTVTLADSTSGATIYYTTNGTTPTTSSSVYGGAIPVSSSETVEAIAVATGYSNSAVATAAYTITTQAATPTFSVAAGTYSSTQTVTLADSTSGATIYYTTNGTTPTTGSSVYGVAITVSSSETVEAIAVATGYSNSAVATAAYTITTQAATPTFSVAGGTYTSTQTVTLADSTSGATIYYTTNGTTPTTGSSVYGGAITVSSTETIEAIAVATGYSNSAVATAAYVINTPQAATPTFGVAGGTYTSTQTVTLADSTSGATIYYTTNGTIPTTGSSVYGGAITVSSSETVEAIAVTTGYSNSAVATAAYIITIPVPGASLTPTAGLSFTATNGTSSAAQTATLMNTGTASLTITSITFTGTNATSFAQTNTCGTSLAAGASCAISVTFAPGSVATFSAAISVADNASGSPQTVTLSGSGTAPVAPTFTVTSSAPTQSVVAGSSATFPISVSPQNGAFTSAITFSASGLPTGATATFSPTTVTPGSTAASTTLTVTTPVNALLQRPFELPFGTRPISLAVLVLLFLPGKRHRRKVWLGLMLMVSIGATALLSGCGGGFAMPGPASTTYTITVTAAGGSVQQTTTLQLTVKE